MAVYRHSNLDVCLPFVPVIQAETLNFCRVCPPRPALAVRCSFGQVDHPEDATRCTPSIFLWKIGYFSFLMQIRCDRVRHNPLLPGSSSGGQAAMQFCNSAANNRLCMAPLHSQCVGLPGAVAFQPPNDCGAAPGGGSTCHVPAARHSVLAIIGFIQGVNLVSFLNGQIAYSSSVLLLPGGEKNHDTTAACPVTDQTELRVQNQFTVFNCREHHVFPYP